MRELNNIVIPDYSVYFILFNRIENNNIQYLKSDYRYLNDYLKDNQKTSYEVVKLLEKDNSINKLLSIEQEIYDEEINKNMKAHGQRHILNVVLFSMILGLELLNKKDLDLLLISAKYHDVGRTEEGGQEHAYASSLIARKKLAGMLSDEELSIITTAIEFHEIPRNSTDEEVKFDYIARKNGVRSEQLHRARIISEILKDADALDRTRFVNRARLDNRYLKFDNSKKLIKLSANIQETYALQDLAMYEYNQNLVNYNTPQELLRKIRKNEYSQNMDVIKKK